MVGAAQADRPSTVRMEMNAEARMLSDAGTALHRSRGAWRAVQVSRQADQWWRSRRRCENATIATMINASAPMLHTALNVTKD